MKKCELLDNLEQKIRCCDKCPFDPKTSARYCGGRGDDYRVMFIGESPSPMKQRGILSRHSGFKGEKKINAFNDIRKEYGLEKTYITDLVKCGVTKIKPTKLNLSNCTRYLQEELDIVKPRVIVLIGKGILFRDGDYVCKGSFSELFRKYFIFNVPLLEVDHYSYIYRFKVNDKKAICDYRNDIKRILDYL